MKGARRGSGTLGFLALVLAVLPAPARAQMLIAVEVRAGATYSTPFARGRTLVPAELEAVARDLEVGPRIGPAGELALSGRPDPSVAVEVRAGGSMVRVVGKGGDASWEAGRATALHFLGGVRFPLTQVPGMDVRVAAGKVLYLSSDVNVLEGPEDTGVLLSAGLGYRLPGPLRLTGFAEVQRHPFDPAPLSAAGAGAGTVTRVQLHLSMAVWGTS